MSNIVQFSDLEKCKSLGLKSPILILQDESSIKASLLIEELGDMLKPTTMVFPKGRFIWSKWTSNGTISCYFSELTPAMINEFIEKILVHQAEGKGASRTQEIEIFFNFVGKVEIPHEEVELTEEEIAAIAEQERRRAKKAEYNRRYMQKKRKQWKEQQEQAQEPQEPIELPLVQDEKGALSA